MSDRLSILESHNRARHRFDPSNKEHLKELRYFMTNGKWQSGCPFYLEEPYLEIPAMCAQRYLEHSLA